MPLTVDCGHADADLLLVRGSSILVQIGFDPNYRRGLKPVQTSQGYRALVDTGASKTCIDSGVARSLNLPIVDEVVIAGVHGSDRVNIHLAQIYIPSFNLTVSGNFVAVKLHESGQPYGALLGRSFLRNFKLEYDGTNGAASLVTPD